MKEMDGYRLGPDEARILARDRVRELRREARIARAGRLGRDHRIIRMRDGQLRDHGLSAVRGRLDDVAPEAATAWADAGSIQARPGREATR
jgi:hypothetical protein